jgi:ATP-binding cassette subfamily F protein uup
MAVLLGSESLSKSYGPRRLFAGISLDVRDGERIGLIGPNGAGKSTLLKIFAGLEMPDEGRVARLRKSQVCYVPQEAVFDAERTVEQILADSLEVSDLEEHERATRVGITLGKFGFVDFDQKAGTLSGGWRKRLALARELVKEPTLLLLDEPTNHLDLEGILWLEELLTNAPFAYVVVSHDRYFLENVANQIVELDRIYPEGYLRFNGAYSDFLSQRDEFQAMQARQEETLANKVRREIEWLRRGAKARTGKSTARINEAGRLIDDLQSLKNRNAQKAAVDIDFAGTGRKSTKLVVADKLSKTLGGKALFRDVGFLLSPGTKLGLLGANGSGKSSLLRILTGELSPDSGSLVRADGVRVVTFDQDRKQLDRTATLRRALSPNSETVTYRDRPYHITAWAKRFLFQPEQLDLPVGDLSGGEQARILIARLMLQPADVLLLDEPTNDLDIPSLEVLEESLAEFPGALVLVTHDRSMLDRLCTEILGLDGQGNARMFADYSQWTAAQREARVKPAAVVERAAKAPREKPKKLSYNEQREYAEMEARILAAEQEVAARENDVAAAGADHVRLQKSCHDLQAAQEAVAKLYHRWQELEAKILPVAEA